MNSAFLSLVPILLLAVLLLVVGGAVVLLVSRDGRAEKKKAVPIEPPLPDLDFLAPAAPPSAPVNGVFTVTLADGAAVPATEVMRLLRDVATGRLIAQMGGLAFVCPPETADAEFVRRYEAVLRDLSVTPVEVPQPVAAVAAPQAEPAPPQPVAAAPVPLAEPAPPSPPIAPRPGSAAGAPLPGDLPRFTSPESKESPRLGRKPTVTSVPDINIGQSIEAYLQYRLADHDLAGRSIHVLPAGADGVRIEVDGHSYDGIDLIPDPAVQNFLRQAIADWQYRQ
jgi:hypothetical protein